jgi:hypothetical protein
MEIFFIIVIIIIIAIMFLSISREAKIVETKDENTHKSVSEEIYGESVLPAYSTIHSFTETDSIGDLLDDDLLEEIMEESMDGSFSMDDDHI